MVLFMEKFNKLCAYLTMLSTAGFHDFHPQNRLSLRSVKRASESTYPRGEIQFVLGESYSSLK